MGSSASPPRRALDGTRPIFLGTPTDLVRQLGPSPRGPSDLWLKTRSSLYAGENLLSVACRQRTFAMSKTNADRRFIDDVEITMTEGVIVESRLATLKPHQKIP